MGKISVTIATDDDGVFPIEVEDTDAISKLSEMVEMITGMPPSKQRVLLAGKAMPSSGTIAAAGVRQGDLIAVEPNSNPFQISPDGSAAEPEAFLAALRQNPAAMQQLSSRSPALQAAITSGNIGKLQAALRQMAASIQAAQQQPQMPEGDPLDPEYQKKMYEAIQQKNVMENYEHALEHSPEVFGQVDMLYVDMSVNGEPVKAFIDSGAQSTIMTTSCAEKCRIMRLIDKRFAGVAVGVGSAKIVGRIHSCALHVGASFISTSVTVLDQRDGPQFIFGLDNLKRHQCAIDLAAGELRIGSCATALPFLGAHAVPTDFNVKRVQPEDAAEQLDASGSVKEAIEGDIGVLQGSGSLPAAGAAGAAGPSAAPAAAGAVAGTSQGGGTATVADGAPAAEVEKLQSVTGRPAGECLQALQACNGNADAAAAMLLGL